MAIATFKRYELKFKLTKGQFEALYPKIIKEMEPDAFCRNGRHYTVHNIYYDTKDNALIRASIAKPIYKEKLRLRSYTVPAAPESKVFLELKKKTAGVVHKRRAVVTRQQAYNFIALKKSPHGESYIDRQVIREIEYFFSHNDVYPAVYVGYKRIAFFGKEDKNFRLTFDYDITTRRHDLLLEKGMYGKSLLLDGTYLMEVKISGALPLWLAGALSELEIYKTSFSKYGTEYKHYCAAEPREQFGSQPGEEKIYGSGLCANY